MTAILEEVGSYEKLAQVMQDENAFIAERMETCFKLKHKGGEKALEALATGLTSTSTLLKHEICYVMGQMRDTNAITILEKVLRDATEVSFFCLKKKNFFDDNEKEQSYFFFWLKHQKCQIYLQRKTAVLLATVAFGRENF